jgi:sensor c-di-GMP phosphodiesterase-like protein
MEPREKAVGLAAAGVLAVIAVLFLTSHNPRPPQPDPAGPVAGLVAAGLVVVSLLLAHRIVTGLLAIVTAFLLQTPHVAHGVVWLRKGGLVVAVAFALWLTLQQRHAQIDNRLRRAVERHQGGDG